MKNTPTTLTQLNYISHSFFIPKPKISIKHCNPGIVTGSTFQLKVVAALKFGFYL